MSVGSGAQAVAVATQWLGTPYQWGGGHGGPAPIGTPVDCSGLVDQVFGISGNTGTQVKLGSKVASIAKAGPGDLIFFGALAPGEPHHVGIYTGVGLMIDAPHTGTVVRRDTVANFGAINAIRRLVPTNSDTSSTQTGGNLIFTYAQLEAVWIQAGGNPQTAPMAAAIAMAESGGNSTASNSNSNASIDRGLWQINSSNGAGSSFDVMTNARAAVSMSGGGTNWRPWCTAYGDGACGTKGGAYLAANAPFQRFLNTSVQPDYTMPLNGTNAAANQGGDTNATLESSFFCSVPPLNLACSAGGIPGAIGTGIANAIESVLKDIFNPFLTIVAGVLGITAGGVLMIYGMYMVISSSNAIPATMGQPSQQQDQQRSNDVTSSFLGPNRTTSSNPTAASTMRSQRRMGRGGETSPSTQQMLQAEALRYPVPE